MSDPYLVVLDTAETAGLALLSALARAKGLTPERARLIKYGIERVEVTLTLCKQTLLLVSSPGVLDADPTTPPQLPR